MTARKIINPNKKKTKKYKIKKGAFISLCVISVIGGSICVNSIKDSIQEKKEEQIKIELQLKKEKEEKEKLLKLKQQFPGVGEKGLNNAYDANIIWERLQKYDYSPLEGQKVVFLTYDDGPSTTNTPVILDTLKKHNVNATFFVTGKTLEDGKSEAMDILKRAYNDGNAIANHSYSHNYKILYPGRTLDFNAFKEDFGKTDELLQGALGEDFKTKVWRCPGGYMSWKGMETLKQHAVKEGIGVIDWNALNKDAEGKKKNADELFQEAVSTSKNKDMIVLLMHDTYGKEETAKYTDRIIQYYKDNGYIFKTLG